MNTIRCRFRVGIRIGDRTPLTYIRHSKAPLFLGSYGDNTLFTTGHDSTFSLFSVSPKLRSFNRVVREVSTHWVDLT